MSADPTTTGPAGLSADVARLSRHADGWSRERVLDEGLDLVRDATWADACRLFRIDEGGHAEEVAARPADLAPRLGRQPATWFPWGLAPVNPRRFVLISDAAALACTPDGSPLLGEIGVVSCLHLPILERQRPIGAMQLFWTEPRLAWDDERGRLLRLLGRFLLDRCGDTTPEVA